MQTAFSTHAHLLAPCLALGLVLAPSLAVSQARTPSASALRTASVGAGPAFRAAGPATRDDAGVQAFYAFGDLAILGRAPYVYAVADDYQGALPPVALGKQPTDLLQWYRDGLLLGAQTGDLAMLGESLDPALAIFELVVGVGTTQGGGIGVDPVFANGGPAFDVDEFEQQILDRMDDEAAGFSYVINFEKQYARGDGVGFARNSNDGYVGQSQYKRMNIASISKTLTAIAVLQLLETLGKDVDDPISPYLPADWTQGYGFDDPQILTFRDLLTHRSGIKQTMEFIKMFDEDFGELDFLRWDGLKEAVERGIASPYHGQQKYTNVNYALFRVIIPALWREAGEPVVDDLDEGEAAAVYQNYMGYNVFLPLDIQQATCHDLFETSPTLYYSVSGPHGEGAEAGNWILSCGSSGWHLSAYELAKVMAHLRYGDLLLSPESRELMEDLMLGWWGKHGDHGVYRSHGGKLYFDGADDPNGREMNGCIMQFPIHVEAVLLVNSSIEGSPDACNVLRDAFDAAWID